MLSMQEAELMGMHTGDGSLYKTSKNSLVWEIRGGLDEKEYYNTFVKKLLKQIFDITCVPKIRSGGAKGSYGIQTSRKEITAWLIQKGFKPGSKTFTVRIPNIIFKSSKQAKYAFIRGFFDTDGCLRFDSNKYRKHFYPKIELSSASKGLIDDLISLLKTVDLDCYYWQDRAYHKICLAGKFKTMRGFKTVSSNNPKHLNKFLNWKNKGL